MADYTPRSKVPFQRLLLKELPDLSSFFDSGTPDYETPDVKIYPAIRAGSSVMTLYLEDYLGRPLLNTLVQMIVPPLFLGEERGQLTTATRVREAYSTDRWGPDLLKLNIKTTTSGFFNEDGLVANGRMDTMAKRNLESVFWLFRHNALFASKVDHRIIDTAGRVVLSFGSRVWKGRFESFKTNEEKPYILGVEFSFIVHKEFSPPIKLPPQFTVPLNESNIKLRDTRTFTPTEIAPRTEAFKERATPRDGASEKRNNPASGVSGEGDVNGIQGGGATWGTGKSIQDTSGGKLLFDGSSFANNSPGTLKPNLRPKALEGIVETQERSGHKLGVSSVSDGPHSGSKSWHHDERAVDINSIDNVRVDVLRKTPEGRQKIKDVVDAGDKAGAKQNFNPFNKADHQNHIHLGWPRE